MFNSTSFTSRQTYSIPFIGFSLIIALLIFDINEGMFIYINSLSSYTGESIWPFLTILGDPLVVVCIGLSFLHIQPKIAIAILPSLIIGAILVFSLKWSIDVARPGVILDQAQFILLGNTPISPAFPSGHTTGIFTLATLLMLFSKKTIFTILILIAACLIGLSRIMVGAHWPLDVAGGMILGWAISLFSIHISQKWSFDASKQKTLSFILIFCSISLIFKSTGYSSAIYAQLFIAFCGISIGLKQLKTKV